MPSLPKKCDGCGEELAIDYALSCKKGGLISSRYHHLQLELADMLGKITNNNQIKTEPVLPSSKCK